MPRRFFRNEPPQLLQGFKRLVSHHALAEGLEGELPPLHRVYVELGVVPVEVAEKDLYNRRAVSLDARSLSFFHEREKFYV